MLKNFINYEDIRRGTIRLKSEGFSYFKGKMFGKKAKRVANSWNCNMNNSSSWDNIPYIVKLREKTITSGKFLSYREYFVDKYLMNKEGIIALSPGCGIGNNEIKWAKLKIFKKIKAFDISKTRIEKALEIAKKNKMADIIDFYINDIGDLENITDKYDVIFFEGSLHHMSPIKVTLSIIKKKLQPDGVLLINDFFGPSRFQWTDKQIEIAETLLLSIPEKLRIMNNGDIKKKIYKPGWLKMYLADPSEAADSSNMMTNIKNSFDILEYKQLGGTILNLLFSDIAHNFLEENNKEIKDILDNAILVEKENLHSGIIGSDFNFIVCRL